MLEKVERFCPEPILILMLSWSWRIRIILKPFRKRQQRQVVSEAVSEARKALDKQARINSDKMRELGQKVSCPDGSMMIFGHNMGDAERAGWLVPLCLAANKAQRRYKLLFYKELIAAPNLVPVCLQKSAGD